MAGLPSPVQTIQATLKTIDSTLASVGVAAEAVHTSLTPLPPITSDYNDAAPSSLVSKGIDAVRAQVQRGFPVAATPPEIIVRLYNSSSIHPYSRCHQKTTLDGIATKLHLPEGLDDRKDAVRQTI
jgi:hypothetical protein